jgi:Protein of unknown function (DUF1592)/Protein of unknown function (DUF1588)/Protein of unknown function (DUF1595)/Protein of unknown function (DUF1585)/Protein of unknown function (DUF1587)
MRDLFAFDTGRPADDFPDDVAGGDEQNNNGLNVSDLFLEKHEAAVTELSRKAVANGLAQCEPKTANLRSCVESTIIPFMRRAWRRPVSADEVENVVRMADVVAVETTEPEPLKQALALAIQQVLMSPHFLFRFETLQQPTEAVSQPLGPFEMASRLSYFIFGSLPDSELFAAAELGALETPDQIESQVRRMVSDPKAQRLTERIAEAWLWNDKVDVVNPKPAQYPAFDTSLRQSLKTETALFLRDFLQNEGHFKDMLDADFTFVNQRLAKHYGLSAAGATSDAFERMSLRGNPHRGGFLTQGSVLAATSAPLNNPAAAISETNVIVRGKFVLKQLLCANLEVPAGIDFVGIQSEAQRNIPTNAPRKVRDAVRQAKPECASCHSQLDPIGFSMERFDVTGALRDTDTFGAAVDSTGQLKDDNGSVLGQFDGARGLGSLLKDDPRLTQCLTRTVFRLAVGRSLADTEQCRLRSLSEQTLERGGTISKLILSLTLDHAFTQQTGETP